MEHHSSLEDYEKVRAVRVKNPGLEHADTLNTLSSLGMAYRDAGKLLAAIELLEQVRDIRKKTLNANHPESVPATRGLAVHTERRAIRCRFDQPALCAQCHPEREVDRSEEP